MNKFAAIQAFCLVCEQSSFAKVAKQLSISPTMVGRYIKQLEQQLGTLLVKRTTRSMTITEAGKLYYHQVQPLLIKLNEAEQQLNKFSDIPQGKLRISSSIEFGGQYLAPVVASYHQLYPKVELSVNLTNEPVDIAKGEVDLVFRIAPKLANASLKTVPICYSRLAFWASSDYLAKYEDIKTIEALADHQLLFFEHSIRPNQWLYQQGNEVKEICLPWAWKSNNGRILNEAAALGQGIIQAPSYSVKQYVANEQLVEVLPQHSLKQLTISAVYQHSYQFSLAIKTFVEHAKIYFKQHPIQ